MCNGTKNNTKSEDKWKAIDRMSGLILLPALHETDPNMVNNDLFARILGWRRRLAMIIENVDLISEDQLIAR